MIYSLSKLLIYDAVQTVGDGASFLTLSTGLKYDYCIIFWLLDTPDAGIVEL